MFLLSLSLHLDLVVAWLKSNTRVRQLPPFLGFSMLPLSFTITHDRTTTFTTCSSINLGTVSPPLELGPRGTGAHTQYLCRVPSEGGGPTLLEANRGLGVRGLVTSTIYTGRISWGRMFVSDTRSFGWKEPSFVSPRYVTDTFHSSRFISTATSDS